MKLRSAIAVAFVIAALTACAAPTAESALPGTVDETSVPSWSLGPTSTPEPPATTPSATPTQRPQETASPTPTTSSAPVTKPTESQVQLPESLPECYPLDCELPVQTPLGSNLAQSVSADVAYAQLALNHCFGSGLTVDGRYGPQTEAAVRALQTHYREVSVFKDPTLPVTGELDARSLLLIGFYCYEGD